MNNTSDKKAIKKIHEIDQKKKKIKSNYNWVIKITVAAFFISFIMSTISNVVLPTVNTIFGIVVIILVIFIGILFDMIGIAVTAADEKPFHAMNAKKVRGAALAVKYIKNSAKLSSFCNDVVGDICGIISGTIGVIIATDIASIFHLDVILTNLFVTAIIASLTIGGKAMGKSLAVNKSNTILFKFAKIISYFKV